MNHCDQLWLDDLGVQSNETQVQCPGQTSTSEREGQGAENRQVTATLRVVCCHKVWRRTEGPPCLVGSERFNLNGYIVKA